MAIVRYSRLAESDLIAIGEYTLQTWGMAQADRYLSQMEECCRHLARNPRIGRSCPEIRPGLRLMKQGRHVIFYRVTADGIFVSRILHQRMLPERHPV